jgi:hypothetical protein
VNWIWMSSNCTIVVRRPASISLLPKADGISVLHNENNYALKFKDGTGICVLNDIGIPKKYEHLVLLPRDKVSAKEVMSIPDTTIRGAIIRRMGPEFMFKNLDKKIIDAETIPYSEFILLECVHQKAIGGMRRCLLTLRHVEMRCNGESWGP